MKDEKMYNNVSEDVTEAVNVGIPDIFRIFNETVGLSMKIFRKPIRGTGSVNCAADIGDDTLNKILKKSIDVFIDNYPYEIMPVLNKIKGSTLIIIKVDRPYFEYDNKRVCALVNTTVNGNGDDKSMTSLIFIAQNNNLSERQTLKLIKHELVHVAIKYATALLGLRVNSHKMEEFLCDYIPYIPNDDNIKKAADVMADEISDYTPDSQKEYSKILECIV